MSTVGALFGRNANPIGMIDDPPTLAAFMDTVCEREHCQRTSDPEVERLEDMFTGEVGYLVRVSAEKGRDTPPA